VIQTHAAESAVKILTEVINLVDGFAGNSEKSDQSTKAKWPDMELTPIKA
jgi:hypothetical protein